MGHIARWASDRFIKLCTMKEFFAKIYRGHQFEFTRVLSSSFDPWYHISVNLNNVAIKYRMHADKDGTWKIQPCTGYRPFYIPLKENLMILSN